MTFLKYLVIAALFIFLGPMAMRYMFGNQSRTLKEEIVDADAGRGMPVDPDKHNAGPRKAPVNDVCINIFFSEYSDDGLIFCLLLILNVMIKLW